MPAATPIRVCWPGPRVSVPCCRPRVLLLVLLVALLLGLWPARPVLAQGDAPGFVPVPAEGHDPRVVLNALTVDITVQDDATAPSLAVVVRLRLLNSSTTEPARAVLRLQARTQRGERPALSLVLGTDPAQAQPYEGDLWSFTLRPDQRQWVTVTYTEPLPPTLWARVAYGVDRLAVWPTVVGSVRVTLHFPRRLDQRAMLEVAPDPSRYDGEVWEWQWEDAVPPQAVRAVFFRPTWWDRMQAWRAAAKAGDVNAAAQLAEALTEAVVDPTAPAVVAEVLYPEALALWTQVANARPEDPTPWQALARLYAAQAATSTRPDAYRALAVAALEAAWERGAQDPALREELAQAVREQIRAYVQARRWQDALRQVDRLAALLGPEGEDEVTRLRQDVALAWAQDRLTAGDLEGVQTAVEAGWGSRLRGYFLPRRPALRYLGVEVLTTDARRAITVTATLDPDVAPNPREAWASMIQEWRKVLPEGAVTAAEQGHTVVARVVFPYTTAADIRRVQERLLTAVPETPAWALLQDALRPRDLVLQEAATWWGAWREWRETVDLSPSRQALDDAITGVRLSLRGISPQDFPRPLLPALERLRAEDIAAWEALRDRSDVVYRIRWRAGWLPPTYRRWHLRAGEQALLFVRRPIPDPARVAGVGFLALAGWTLGTWALWRWLGRG